MLADEYHSTATPAEFLPAGQLDKQALPCFSRDAVLDIIETALTEFAQRADLCKIQNEKGITNRLCKILNCQKLLYFHHEGMQDEETGASPSVDVEAVATTATVFEARLYAKEQTLMAVEAKRLPSPPPKSREREYLIGSGKRSGGLERFKLGIHGKSASAWTMLGYIQSNEFSSWHSMINGWLEDLVGKAAPPGMWKFSEKLKLIAERQATARFKSRMNRFFDGRKDSIEIAHVWVLLNPVSRRG